MKKLIAALAFIGFCMVTHAQADTTNHKPKAHKPGTYKRLVLTKEQQARIKAASKNYNKKSVKIKGDSTLTPAQKKQQIATLKKEKQKEVNAVLTAEQRKKLQDTKSIKKKTSPQKSKTSPKTKKAG